MSCADYYYIKEIQEQKKKLAEIEEMETLANQNNTKIHWFADFAYVSFNTGVEDPETGEDMTIGQMIRDMTYDSLYAFIAGCKQEMANNG